MRGSRVGLTWFTCIDVKPLAIDLLLARIDHRIVLLRRWLRHDHRDEPYWWARGLTAKQAQSERAYLRMVANLLRVDRANTRDRCHNFASLDEQRAWLAVFEHRRCPPTAALLRLPPHATLALLRSGELPS